MQFVSTDSNQTAHMKTLIEQCHSLSLRPLVRLFLSHKDLNLLGKKTTDGRSTACGENSDLLERLPG
jgi:hypothetical protein